MGKIGFKNLVHDRVRLAVTLTGIIFALVLILVQFGLFLGFLETSSNIVARSGADLWIAAPAVPHVNGGAPLMESKRWRALTVQGVARVDRYALFFVNWKLPSGAVESVQVAGFEPQGGMGGPWALTAGSVEDLRGEDTVIVDELYREKLGIRRLGEVFEINGRRARVVGFTKGIRSFTTSPYVFTSFKNSQKFVPLAEDQTIYFLVRLAPDADVQAVKAALQARLTEVEIHTNEEMRRKTQNYWVFQTGAGVTTLMGAILGLLVGVVVVAQTIYAATVDHIREFGTLKAMGARNGHIYRVILTQAGLSGLMGYGVAIVVAMYVARSSETGNAIIALPPEMAIGTLALALGMCAAASVISIRKATRIDPAMVFRG
jgi:putative ABC transport system permease protein